LSLYSGYGGVAEELRKRVEKGVRIVEVEKKRGGKQNDVLNDDSYKELISRAANGQIVGIIGGPNCKSWSILLHTPREGFPTPKRSRDCPYGIVGLTAREQNKLDLETELLHRMVLIFMTAVMFGKTPAYVMEHPEDPEMVRMRNERGKGGKESKEEEPRREIASWWATEDWKDLKEFLQQANFDQGPLGHATRKPTTIGTNLEDLWRRLEEKEEKERKKKKEQEKKEKD
jgi:hypothetical protein